MKNASTVVPTYKPHIEDQTAEVAANALICLIHQTNYLLDPQVRQLEQQFWVEGGFTEKFYRVRRQVRNTPGRRS